VNKKIIREVIFADFLRISFWQTLLSRDGGIRVYIREIKNRINLPENILKRYNMKKIAYFDVETTGFDKEKDTIILISLGSFQAEDYFVIKQLCFITK